MDDIKAKQQVVEKIQGSTNILVTVSNNPSVDSLAAAIGLTLMLDTLGKHATAVFSGTVPPAIAFLEPEKVLDDTTDSLRDFIIALDKEKADHLRYKVEGDSVKIFITPYKTTITSNDLEFSQGDYNVELVLALGVDNQDHLDKALEDHGQILHDATVVTVSAGEQTSTLGGIDWHDPSASSLSEMLAGLAEALKLDADNPILDAQSATALLTGIVAQTDRFSNKHTTAKVMTMASQLIAAGADQQLIATKLEAPYDGSKGPIASSVEPESTAPVADTKPATPGDGLSITHQPTETLEEMDKRVKAAQQEEAAEKAADILDHTANAVPAGVYAIQDDTAPSGGMPVIEPTLGGTLNATTEQAADDARKEAESDQNKTILSHSYLGNDGTPPPMNANESAAPGYVLGGQQSTPAPEPLSAPTTVDTPVVIAPITPVAPIASGAPSPADLGLPMPPSIPDVSAPPVSPAVMPGLPIMPPSPSGPYAPVEPVPERLGDILAAEPAVASPVIPDAAAPAVPVVPNNDPAQFKIPGQS